MLGLRDRSLTVAGGLEAFQFREGFLIRTLANRDAALQAHERGAGLVEHFAQGVATVDSFGGEMKFPELRFGTEQAAQQPFVANQGIDI